MPLPYYESGLRADMARSHTAVHKLRGHGIWVLSPGVCKDCQALAEVMPPSALKRNLLVWKAEDRYGQRIAPPRDYSGAAGGTNGMHYRPAQARTAIRPESGNPPYVEGVSPGVSRVIHGIEAP